jgi:hypothetical protein
MPSKLDPHLALIEGWLAAEPWLTAIAIVGRLAELHPDQFGNRQHSIVQRLLRALRKSTAQRFLVETAAEGIRERRAAPGAVDGLCRARPDFTVPVLNVDPSANVLRPSAW